MSNISEFERTKPKETHKAFEEARKKYEAILRETTVMDDVEAKQFEEMAQQAATRAVEATEAVKVLEAKLTASTAAE